MHLKTKIFQSGNSLAVRIPKTIPATVGDAEIWVDSDSNIVIAPVVQNGWGAFMRVLEETQADHESLEQEDREFFEANDRDI